MILCDEPLLAWMIMVLYRLWRSPPLHPFHRNALPDWNWLVKVMDDVRRSDVPRQLVDICWRVVFGWSVKKPLVVTACPSTMWLAGNCSENTLVDKSNWYFWVTQHHHVEGKCDNVMLHGNQWDVGRFQAQLIWLSPLIHDLMIEHQNSQLVNHWASISTIHHHLASIQCGTRSPWLDSLVHNPPSSIDSIVMSTSAWYLVLTLFTNFANNWGYHSVTNLRFRPLLHWG